MSHAWSLTEKLGKEDFKRWMLQDQIDSLSRLIVTITNDTIRAKECDCNELVLSVLERQLAGINAALNEKRDELATALSKPSKLKEVFFSFHKWFLDQLSYKEECLALTDQLVKIDKRAGRVLTVLRENIKEDRTHGISMSMSIVRLEDLDKIASDLASTVRDKEQFDRLYLGLEPLLALILIECDHDRAYDSAVSVPNTTRNLLCLTVCRRFPPRSSHSTESKSRCRHGRCSRVT